MLDWREYRKVYIFPEMKKTTGRLISSMSFKRSTRRLRSSGGLEEYRKVKLHGRLARVQEGICWSTVQDLYLQGRR